MRWEQCAHGEEQVARVRTGRARPADGPGRVYRRDLDAVFCLEQETGTVELAPEGIEDARALTRLADLADHSVVWAKGSKGNVTIVRGVIVRERVRLPDALVVALPPEVLEQVPRDRRGQLDAWAQARFGWEGAWLVWGGDHGPISLHGAFQLIGDRKALDLRWDGKGYVATGIRSTHRRRTPTVLHATIRLMPAAEAKVEQALGHLDDDGGTTAAQAVRDAGAFLRVWDQYRAAERELLEKTARDMGTLVYRAWRLVEGGLVFTLGAEVPASWRRPEARVGVEAFDPLDPTHSVLLDEIGGVDPRNPTEIRIQGEADGAPPRKGALRVSLRGDQKRLKRQEDALRKALQRESEMPDLIDVLDGYGRTGGATRKRAVTTSVERLLGFTPSQSQQAAIHAALNTPDIAAIQGPPGAGKTKVLQALAQRLHEEGRAPILLTSYQHEAVLRAIEGLTVGELPVVRVGGRRGEDPGRSWTQLDAWLRGILLRVDESLQGPGLVDPWAELRRQTWRRVEAWRRDPGGRDGARSLVRELERLCGARLDPALLDRLGRLQVELEVRPAARLHEADRKLLLDALASQRLQPEAWADDGPEKVKRLYRRVRGLPDVPQDLVDALYEAQASARRDQPLPDLPIWVDRLRAWASPEEAMVALPKDLGPAVNEVLATLEREATRGGPGLADALLRFRERVHGDPGTLQKVMARYASALGATVQQAVGRDMCDLHTLFEVVIVDEAARANPLDLLIPLVLARRVVLVGDQEQLPHMLEPRLEGALTEGRVGDVAQVLRQSLFARIWERYEHCPTGAFPRTVFLDTQYRMHPVIGEFISRTFYGRRLQTGIQASDRPSVPGFAVDGPVAFFNQDGPRERRAGSSLTRSVEVDRVEALLRPVLARPENVGLSVGVVSFYAAQVDALEERVEALGWKERVAVGTVDAFQGREFDVVMLSTVRSGGEVGFLQLPNRLNVALSRGRRLLGVVGDRSTVAKVPALGSFAELCAERGAMCS